MTGGLLSDFGRDSSDSRTPRSHAPVVHPVEVALLPELVPGALGLLRYDAHLVQLLLEGHDALIQVLVPDIDVGNRVRVHLGQLPLLLEVVPLAVEVI